ncbi:uncharacterized protein N7459_009923 [Penicillium hispanicum]|uniref:uncharacterized protein n=1 Tax=Penicillium hispanicum TaxID=1080232 RepID=UPI002540C08F|nr:uncharacterized protein N7459_009923 [Penicillium hispanicum]KAJ5570493.1 hypothetical protein N7459_009923 [Penicillium hispanicum]
MKGPVDASGTPLKKPKGVRVVAVVFYGRRGRASILECYLRKNLVSNGGWLDEVVWAVNTHIEGDLVYAEEVTKTAHEYTYLSIPPAEGFVFADVWREAFTDEDAIYLKIDDDVIFMEDNAIPRLVTTLIKNPDALTVSANIVNNPAIGWLQYHMGAVHPYIPEVDPKGNHVATRENGIWRASDLPVERNSPWELPNMEEFFSAWGVESDDEIPKHRWVPTTNSIMQTPIALSQYDPYGPNLQYWALGAQAHYSLLQNIEENKTSRYFIIHGNDKASGLASTWRMTGTRLSINFMAIRGRDVLEYMESIVVGDDEVNLTVDLPLAIGRSVLVETTSLGAHFNFGPQKHLAKSDILERYHNYANERVCPGSILEPEFYYEGEDPPEEPPVVEEEPPAEEEEWPMDEEEWLMEQERWLVEQAKESEEIY